MTHIDLINVALGIWVQPMLMIAVLMLVSRNMFMFSAASRHWYFVCVLAAVVVALLLKLILPNILFPAIPLSMSYWLAVPIYDIISPLRFFLGIYMLGVLWFLSYQVMGLADISTLTSKSADAEPALVRVFSQVRKHFNVRNEIALKVTTELSGPVVWGFKHPTILLPASYVNWSEARLSRVLAHECAHIERGDFVVKILGKWVCAIFWIVPLVWLVIKRIEWYAELACDDRVIAIYDERDSYAEDLMSITSDKSSLTWALAFIQSSKLYLRLQYVLDARNYRESVSAKQMTLQFLSLFLLVVPIALTSLTLSFDKWDPSAFYEPQQEENSSVVVVEKSLTEIYDERIESIKNMKSLIQVIPTAHKRPDESLTVFYQSQELNQQEAPTIEKKELVAAAKLDIPNIEIQGVLPLNMVMPVYPQKALLRGIEGKVVVAFDIAADGSVVNPEVIYSSGGTAFNAEVLKAIKKSTFSPMLLGGEPIITKNVTETYRFELNATDKTVSKEENENGISL